MHTHAEAPVPYLRVVLMREFGWTPTEVRAIPLGEMLEIMTCLSVESRYQRQREKWRKSSST